MKNENNNEPFASLLKILVRDFKTIRPKESIHDITTALLREGVVNINPPEEFLVDQGCLGISEKPLITGGLGPCVAVAIRQRGKPRHFLAHMDSYGFRSHDISEIADVIRQHFDPSSPDFEIEVHNWKAHDNLKPTVMKKVFELVESLGHDEKKIILGIPFVTPLHTVRMDRLSPVTASLKPPRSKSPGFEQT
jgi:hypothetical protein